MRWRDLLFAHWPVAAGPLHAALPAGLELDTWEGEAWVGVVPFRMERTAPRWVPPLPCSPSRFLELNVRTYVRHRGRAGVWFFSLDANSPLAVRLARWSFHLPYHHARMTMAATSDGAIDYRSERRHRGIGGGVFEARYRAGEVLRLQAPGTFGHWLTERYFLATATPRGELRVGEIHHAPWPLHAAEAEIGRCTVAEAFGIALPDLPPVLHFAPTLDVVAWLLQRA